MNTKVTLKELIDVEEILLIIEEKLLFELPYGKIVILDKHLDRIGKITNRYFTILTDYENHLKNNSKEELSIKEKNVLMKKFNDRIINDEIEFNLFEISLFIKEIITLFDDNEVQEKFFKLKDINI